eukprot:gene50386-61644_t
MDKLAIPMRETVGHAIRCELLRAQVFAGQRTPVVFGQPEAWVAQLIESLKQQAEGKSELAADLAAKAFEAAPASAGSIDGQRFEWLADADSRLGPVLEVCLNGHYTWVPFQHLAKIHFDAPEDLRDCVWMPAQLSFTNGGSSVALVPTRYPGSEKSEDGLVNLARKTEWLPLPGEDRYAGLGQRAAHLGLLRGHEIGLAAGLEPGARIVHRRVEPEPVEIIAQVVVGGDVAAAAGAAVAVEQVAQPLQRRAPPAAVDHPLDHLAVGDEQAQQGGEIGAVPVARQVAVGQADVAALQHG